MKRGRKGTPVRRIPTVYTGTSLLFRLNVHQIAPILRDITDNVNEYGIVARPTPKGPGKFATNAIDAAGVCVGIYMGRLHLSEARVQDNGRHFDLGSVNGVRLFVEGAGPSALNAADFNHSCCRANVAYKFLFEEGLKVVVVITLRRIEPGEELLVDYGDGYFQPGGTAPCLCEAVCPKNRFFA
jgi:hypothetical protein